MTGERLRVEAIEVHLPQHLGELVDVAALEQDPGFAVDHRLQHSPDAEGNHRPPGRLRLDGRDPELLDVRDQEGAGLGQNPRQLGVPNPPEEIEAWG